MEMQTVFLVAIGAFGVIGLLAGGGQGRGLEGFFLGILLGPWGVVMAMMLAPSREVAKRLTQERLAIEWEVRKEAEERAAQAKT